MKTLLITLLFNLVFITLNAQSGNDVIIKTDGTEMTVKITEIEETRIKYKELDYLEGPTRSIKLTEVFMVLYGNGEREIFNSIKSVDTQKPQPAASKTEAVIESYAPKEPVVENKTPATNQNTPASDAGVNRSSLYPVGLAMQFASGLGNGSYGMGLRYVGYGGNGVKGNAGIYSTTDDVYVTFSLSYLAYWDFAKGFYSEISFGSMDIDEYYSIYEDGYGNFNYSLYSSRRWGTFVGFGYEWFGDFIGVNAGIHSGYSWGDSEYQESYWQWQYELGLSIRF